MAITFTNEASIVWRNYITDGIPASGLHSPRKGDIRTWGTEVEDYLKGELALDTILITGGSITGITDLAIADGGTGASTAADARTNLGLGTVATQSAASVDITGGTISGITSLATAAGAVSQLDDVQANTLRTRAGNWLVTMAGEAGEAVRDFLAGNTTEVHYLGGEAGAIVAASPDNLASGAAGMYQTTLIDTLGDMSVHRHIKPNTDNTSDLGQPGQEFRNLYIDGTAEIDTLTVQVSASFPANAIQGSMIADGSIGSEELDSSQDMTTSNVLNATKSASVGAVGSYAFLRFNPDDRSIGAGSTYSGSDLRYAGVWGSATSTSANADEFTTQSPSGTWRSMGRLYSAPTSVYRAMTLFLRIS